MLHSTRRIATSVKQSSQGVRSKKFSAQIRRTPFGARPSNDGGKKRPNATPFFILRALHYRLSWRHFSRMRRFVISGSNSHENIAHREISFAYYGGAISLAIIASVVRCRHIACSAPCNTRYAWPQGTNLPIL
jgi:hypothetical protein